MATMADGTETRLTKSIAGTAIIQDRPLEYAYYILPGLDPEILLGMDALQRLQIRIFLGECQVIPDYADFRENACAESPTPENAPQPLPLGPGATHLPHRRAVLPDGTAFLCPIGVRRYRLDHRGLRWSMRLIPETGEIRHIGEPRARGDAPPT